MIDAAIPSNEVRPRLAFAQPLVRGRLISRYKRFFVDVEVDGIVHTGHTANTGAMTGLLQEGAPVLLTRHDNPKRKYPLELEAIRIGDTGHTGDNDDDAIAQRRATWVSVNTIRANRVARAFIEGGALPALGTTVTATEVRVDESRIDLQVGTTLVEVKSVTLREGDDGSFPDARSERALKHIRLLQRLHEEGRPTALLYLCQRTDVIRVRPAWEIDPIYAAAVDEAARAGVQILALGVGIEVLDGKNDNNNDNDDDDANHKVTGASICTGPLPVATRPGP